MINFNSLLLYDLGQRVIFSTLQECLAKKKLSKYFKDEKLSLIQKSKVLLLCSNDDVVWVVGMRPDARFLATSKTKHILNVNVVHATD